MSQLQTVVIVPEAQWLAVLERIENLEARDQQPAPSNTTETTETGDTVLNSREAAKYLGMLSSLSVTKARRASRLTGVMINEKEWGFRTSELNRYLTRYQRPLPTP